jgi:hypothetical protein
MEVSERRTRTRAITRDTVFLQIGLLKALEMRREASRVSFLMCPFCVRALLLCLTTTVRWLRFEAQLTLG